MLGFARRVNNGKFMKENHCECTEFKPGRSYDKKLYKPVVIFVECCIHFHP